MEQILYNLAMIDLINFCKQQKINCSGTHTIKAKRGYKYTLIKTNNGKPLVDVLFHKNQTPTHFIYKTNI